MHYVIPWSDGLEGLVMSPVTITHSAHHQAFYPI